MIAKRFREIRRSIGWTQAQVARHLGITMHITKQIEKGVGTDQLLIIREMNRLAQVVENEGLTPGNATSN